MNAVTIDTNTINSLFDNQKRVDELFDSIFDDDSFFISGSSYSSQTESRRSSSEVERQLYYRGESAKESALAINKLGRYYFVLPVILEIAAIYLLATNLM
ncbi:MAG: hypothetical protein ACU836_15735 [Gammaproteobacteria bacterium]